jgi:hypothetical protein
MRPVAYLRMEHLKGASIEYVMVLEFIPDLFTSCVFAHILCLI